MEIPPVHGFIGAPGRENAPLTSATERSGKLHKYVLHLRFQERASIAIRISV
jgi:hypothetical protein